MVPPYEPLEFPLSDEKLNNMKKIMPIEHLKQVEQYFNTSKLSEFELLRYQASLRNQQRKVRRKHNDSLSESKLIKEKIQTSSPAPIIGSSVKTNVLIPLTNHHNNVINNAKLNNNTTTVDGGVENAVLKLILDNNPALVGVAETVTSLTKDLSRNGFELAAGDNNLNNKIDGNLSKKPHLNNNFGENVVDFLNDENSDSETETGEEESDVFVPDESSEEDESIVDDADEDYPPPQARRPRNSTSAKERKRPKIDC